MEKVLSLLENNDDLYNLAKIEKYILIYKLRKYLCLNFIS